MKYNGIPLISRGKESVYVYGDTMHRTVYKMPHDWRFFIKIGSDFVEVYHTATGFSTTPH